MAIPPPGPKGESLGKLNANYWRADMFGFLGTLAQTHGDVVGFDLGRSPCILVNGAAEVRELFFKHEAHLCKPAFVSDSNRGHWGDGLTTLEGAAWQARRPILHPSFKAEPVSSRMCLAARLTHDMLDRWTPGSALDLLREMRILTARIAARVVLDAELEGCGPEHGRSGMLPFNEAYGEEYTSIPGGDRIAPLVMRRPRAPHRMDAAVRIVDERIASGEQRNDVLSELVRARLPGGAGLTRDDILGEVMQMLYAGHLTIPLSLVNFWRDIAGCDVAVNLESEADLLCAHGVPLTGALLPSFCLAALKESMRLHPPAPILYREVRIPFELGGFEFAHDVAVWVSPQLLHHDPRYFPEPDRFLPERFMKRHRPTASQSMYLPFGVGPRVCIASQQALQQMALVHLLTSHRFRLAPIPGDDQSFWALARNRISVE